MKKLIILIPIYNSKKHIKRCLDSILNQNIAEADFEMLIMGNASVDLSVIVAKEYKKLEKF